MGLYLGIDVGTSGVRAMAIDGEGSIVGSARTPLPPPAEQGEAREQSPTLWWDAVASVVTEVTATARPRAVRAVAVDGTSATLLVADPIGEPLAPALLYSDTRARAEAERIARVAPPESAAHGPSSALAKLLHLLPRHPGTCLALSQADWVSGRLLGRFGESDQNNALKLGYDPVARAWPGWLAGLGVPAALLPRVHPPGTPLGTVCPARARELGLGTDTLVASGTTDSVAAFLATGARQLGEAVTSLGSTLVVKVLSDRPVFSPTHGVYSHPLGERWLAGGASNTGGAALLAHLTPEAIEELSRRIDPGRPTGLHYYPLARPGERFPRPDPGLAPLTSPRPADDARFLQGLLEGIAAVELAGYRLLARLGAPYPVRVWTAGGGARNPAWTAIRTRLLRVPVARAPQTEAAYGAALLARQGTRAADAGANLRGSARPP
jgi:hypothetical protein